MTQTVARFAGSAARKLLVALALLSACAYSEPAAAAEIQQVDVYTSGTDGYAIFRIPSIVATTSGTLLAFAEGRKDDGSDTGRIDTVLRRSFDNGETWGPLQVVWSDGENTCGNPAPVVDKSTGRIILLGTWNRGDDKEKAIAERTSRDTRRVFVNYSSDDGATWGGLKEITSSVKEADWRWYATGPCHGIQLNNGQLVIPCNHTEGSRSDQSLSFSHVISSSDGGDTWELGGSTGRMTNESTVAELSDGRLLLNSRSYHGVNRRAYSWSSDGGKTWDGPYLHPQLIEPVCQASLLKLDHQGKSVYLFSNPPSKKRENLTVRISTDECMTWSEGLELHHGFGAYSDLVPLPDEQVGCLYERDTDGKSYGRITFARFPVSTLTE